MEDKIFDAIEAEAAKGTPSQLIADKLVSAGWPQDIVQIAVNEWLKVQIARQQNNDGFKAWLQKYYDMARRAVVLVVGLNLIDTVIALLKPWPIKIMADSVFGDIPAWGPLEPYTGTVTLLAITSLMTISLFIIGTVFGVFRDAFLLKVGFGLNRKIKEESLNHILHLPLFHQERLAKGDYVYRQNVVTDSLSELVLGTRSVIYQSLLVIFGVLIIMLLINPQLTIISIILLPLLYLTIKIVGPKMGVWARKYTENASEISSKINESVNNAETIQAFTLEKKMVGNINKLWQNSYVFSRKNMLWGELLDGTNGLLVTLATSAVMLIGGAAALNAELSFGDLLIFMTYMGYLIGPVEQLIGQITTKNQKLIDVGRIYEVMVDHAGIEYLRQDQHMQQQVKGTIEFNNVQYAYNDQQILKGINFTIPAGQKVGIIGPSGGGKSTILKMIPLFLEPNNGTVTIDGIDTQSVSLKDLRKKIAWVSQTPQLFNENIFENLLEGDVEREVTDQEIEHAVDVSNITEFVVKMPLGFKTPVGEDGGSLSGGQRQRLSIGRALIKDAPIICLDEPTAALDIKSENYIRDSLSQMIQGKTVVMVTHRKPLLDLMDVIYVLDNGTLSDVNNLGGLENYLAKLEGLEASAAEQEIVQEKGGIDPDLVEELLAMYESSTIGGNNVSADNVGSRFAINQPTQPVVTYQYHPEESSLQSDGNQQITEPTPKSQSSQNTALPHEQNTEDGKDDSVEIKLH
jgi:ABC-type bacteriocin/lantibiotic exporter with double-glycine peptidase domain